MKTLPHDDGMIKSMITSGLRGGKSILFLDNVQEQVNSPDLAAALTAGSWSDRLFRTHDEVVIPIRCTWIMAGNRIKFNRDMMRRNVPIFMNAETPNPASDRPVTFYKHQQLHKYVQDNRAKLVWAIHVLVKNWVQKGMPPPVKSPIMQSFNEWSIVLGGILETAGIPGFLSNIQMYLTSRNDDTTVANNFAERVWKKFGEDLQRAVDILSACEVEGGSGGLLSLNKGNEINLDPALDLPIQPRSATVMARDLAKFINEQLLGATTVVHSAESPIRVTWVRKTVHNSFVFGLQKLPD